MMPPASDLVTVSVTVSTDPATAFAIFTEETDLWWRWGPKFRIAGKQPGVLRFEPWLGGRFMEEVQSPSGPQLFTMGRISVWQPPGRFQFEWRGVNFSPGESTQVEVVLKPCLQGRASPCVTRAGRRCDPIIPRATAARARRSFEPAVSGGGI